MRGFIVPFVLSSLLLLGQEPEPPVPTPSPLPIPEEVPPPNSTDVPLPESAPLKKSSARSLLSGDRPTVSVPDYVKFKTDAAPEFDDDGNITFNGYTEVRGDNGLQLRANKVVLNQKTAVIFLSGNVSVYQDGSVTRCDSATYRYLEKKVDTTNIRSGLDPILIEAGRFRTIPHKGGLAYIGEDAGITTHDVQNPGFWLRADKTTIFPGDKVIFRNLKVYAGGTPIFWLPYLSQPFDQRLGYHFTPGGRSNLGVYLKNSYGIMLGGELNSETGEREGAWLLSDWHLDLYSLRGAGFGVDFLDTRVDKKDDFGWLKLYYIHDFRSDFERAGVERGSVTSNRFRLDFAHRFPLWESEVAKYSFETNLTRLSDQFYLEDFEQDLFRTDPAPDNFIALKRRSANSITSLGARLQLNSFYQADTRLPELTHDWIRQPLFGSKFLYESQTSLGFYDEHLSRLRERELEIEAGAAGTSDPRRAEIIRLLEDRGYDRFHTYHELSRPTKIGIFNVTPHLGVGHTNYSAVQGSNSGTSSTHLTAAVDASFKLTRDYPDFRNDKWGIDGALHVIEPYASLSWLRTDELDSSFGKIERLTPTTRPRSRSVGRFTAIDDLQDWQVLRLGVRNRLLTKRNGNNHEWLSLDTYFDTFFDDPEFDREFSNIYNDIHWNPLPWLELELETQFPLFNDSNFTEISTNARFMLSEDFEFQVGYRGLTDHPILSNSQRVTLETFARLNEYWGIGTYHRFEFETGTVELQQYDLHYDFDAWVGSIGLFHRDNRSKDEYGILFNLGIKEIPSLSLPIKVDTE